MNGLQNRTRFRQQSIGLHIENRGFALRNIRCADGIRKGNVIHENCGVGIRKEGFGHIFRHLLAIRTGPSLNIQHIPGQCTGFLRFLLIRNTRQGGRVITSGQRPDDGIAVLNRIEVCDTGNQALLTVAVAIINGKAPFITSLLGRLIIVFITDLQIRPALRQRLIGVLRRGRSELFDR